MYNLCDFYTKNYILFKKKKYLDITFCLWYSASAELNISLQSVSLMTFHAYMNICRTFFVCVNFPNYHVTACFLQVHLDPDKV